MVIDTVLSPPPATTAYRNIFQNYVARNTEVLSGQLESDRGMLSGEMQAKVWLTLSYSLRLEWAWPSTRDLLLKVAPKMEQAAQWDEWLPCLGQGIERSQALGDEATEAHLSLHLGHLLTRMGEPGAAQKWLEQAERIFARLDIRPGRAKALGRLANLAYRTRREREPALRMLDLAFGLLGPEDHGEAYCRFVKGSIELETGEIDAAVDSFTRTRNLAAIDQDQRLEALALLNLGRIYQAKSLYEPAEQHFEWAINTFTAIEDPVNLAVGQLNLGALYLAGNQPGKAVRRYQEAEKVLKQCHGDRRYLAMLYNNKGMAHAALSQWRHAEQAYRAGIALWRDLEQPLARLNVEDNLGCAYLAQGAFVKALPVFDAALQELDALLSTSDEARQLWDEISKHAQDARSEISDHRAPAKVHLLA